MSTNSAVTETKTLSDVHKTTDVFEPHPKSNYDSIKDDYLDIGNNEQLEYEETEEEPLYVVDRTKNFWLNQPIQYNSYNKEKTSSPRTDGRRQPNPCWNCGFTDHALITCPVPRNQRKIAQNRQIFLAQKQQQQSAGRNRYKTQRYFGREKIPFDPKYTPGKISESLLKVLDVPSNGLPVHVYQMRAFGYPMGWLKEAREKYSGISIFTGPNECLPLPGREEGNYVFCSNINKKKLHEYPGFNVPCPPNTIDESKLYNCPEFNPKQSLECMYEALTRIKSKKMATTFPNHNSNSEDLCNAPNSIETLSGKESLIVKEEKLDIKPPSSPEDGEITDDDEDKIADEKLCLNAIKVESQCSTSSEIVPEEPVDEQSHSDTVQSFDDRLDLSVNSDAQSSLSSSLNVDSGSVSTTSSVKRKFGDVKSEVLGTPILKRFSTYKRRPTSASFAKGMVDMIEHENLPNAVGTFKKIKDILNDVRKTLNNLL